MYKAIVYIGRFQPLHNEHLQTMKEGLQLAENLVIVLGSSYCPRNDYNPWNEDERETMIMGSLSKEDRSRIFFIKARDTKYNDSLWVNTIHSELTKILAEQEIKDSKFPTIRYPAYEGLPAQGVAIIGYAKDSSSYYLHMFPQWDFIERVDQKTKCFSASECRKKYFVDLRDKEVAGSAISELLNVPQHVGDFLGFWKNTDAYNYVVKELEFQQKYTEQWEKAPYKPIFVTTDAVVIKSFHVLMVRRKNNPGKGLLALPGGFLDATETIVDSTIREVREETTIQISAEQLKTYVKQTKEFAHPFRSRRGRTITFASLIALGNGVLPSVRGRDDAAEALWIPLSEIHDLRSQMFEDHYDIICNLVGIME
jgi:bifunctional NMN adenylyltransferase/nudix hydrolase